MKSPDRNIEKWLEHPNHHRLTVRDAGYPARLREIFDPPEVLYVHGRVDVLNAPSIAIVGSRNATLPGVRDAEAFAQALSNAGLTIVSGLALGIDAAAHRGGLSGAGSSIAVLGTGIDRNYPQRNRELAERLRAEGAVVSEFPLGTPPLPGNFPRRNRLISGLAQGVLVVEAAMESGSLITARLAVEQNRDVFAVPGSIHAPLSKGCHRLILDGAKLVQSADDILSDWKLQHHSTAQASATEAEDAMLEAIGYAPISVDEIAQATGRSVATIAAHLSLLQLRGRITTLAGGLFQRLAKTGV